MEPLYLEDLSIGQKFTSRPHTVDAEAIKAYAREFDPQLFHLDGEAAKKSLFGGLAASGWHTASLTMRLIVESVPLAGGVIGSGGELSWPRPTKPGDTLRVVTEVLEITPSRSRPDRGTIVMRSTTLNQNDEPVQVFTPKLVVQRRQAGA
ncbi:MAG: MaoC family dehydratase [Hyphomicrobiales bacterium]|nr:MaoC family dehydratase [Hyphomicrobiales bacterium]MBV9114187.1 MaoC family dehydratase [Hyphomicrobiales bacterium]MBV9517232.1 MaoC family dehydratase [Hyphomicrobiales bacterium]